MLTIEKRKYYRLYKMKIVIYDARMAPPHLPWVSAHLCYHGSPAVTLAAAGALSE